MNRVIVLQAKENLLKKLFSHLKSVVCRYSQFSEIAFFANQAKNSANAYLGNNLLLTRIFTGQKMFVNATDLSLTPHLLIDGTWEPDITSLFLDLLKDDDVVFDLGANCGYFGIIAGSRIRTGHIHFFEPNPSCIQLIEKSISVNGLKGRSAVNHYAVSDQSGETVVLHLPHDLQVSATLYEDVLVNREGLNLETDISQVSVETIKIDDYCAKNCIKKVDVIKLDVESHEESVIEGMSDTIKRNPQIKILMEYTLGAYSPNFLATLRALFNYVFVIDDGRYVEFESEDDLKAIDQFSVMLLLKN